MLDWLQSYWGAVVAIVAFLIALKTLVEYCQKELEKHAPLRDWVGRWLVVPSYHDAYRDWLGRQLDRLRARMGGLWSGTALAWCLAIAFAYPAALLLLSYGLGGPGTVGNTEFLPRLGGWRQPAIGFRAADRHGRGRPHRSLQRAHRSSSSRRDRGPPQAASRRRP